MSDDRPILESALGHAITGKDSHVEQQNVFEGLDWKVAATRPTGVPHSLFQLLGHMIYWQDWVVKWLHGKKPAVPKHASGSWPDHPGPESAGEWEEMVRHFQNGLAELERQSREDDLFKKRGKTSRLQMIQTIASHSSYHAGQAVLLRQMLGAWPPPSGGVTW